MRLASNCINPKLDWIASLPAYPRGILHKESINPSPQPHITPELQYRQPATTGALLSRFDNHRYSRKQRAGGTLLTPPLWHRPASFSPEFSPRP